MNSHYPFIEELSLNNWPAFSTLLYDGWVLRFAEGYTKRANSISPLYSSSMDLNHKIGQCESLYARNRLPTVFKITPFAQPEHLDRVLADRGYATLDPTSVQVRTLDLIGEPTLPTATIDEQLRMPWIEQFCRISRLDETAKASITRLLSGIRTKAGYISLRHEDQVVACGLGVIERGWIGLYDIVADAPYRNRGFAEQMILHLLRWGKQQGASHSYLAVAANNAPALRLYAKLGYKETYRYWYRVAP
jgi:GNAT superfamily N-acetyltransferase